MIILDESGDDITESIPRDRRTQLENVQLRVRGYTNPDGLPPADRDQILENVTIRARREVLRGMFF